MLEDILQDVVARKPLTWIDVAETVVREMFGCERLRLDGIRRTIRRARAIGTLEPKKSAPLNLTSNGALAKAEEASKRGLTPPCDSGKRLLQVIRQRPQRQPRPCQHQPVRLQS